jgi:hypothetical protein
MKEEQQQAIIFSPLSFSLDRTITAVKRRSGLVLVLKYRDLRGQEKTMKDLREGRRSERQTSKGLVQT